MRRVDVSELFFENKNMSQPGWSLVNARNTPSGLRVLVTGGSIELSYQACLYYWK
jgi:hypothetical protein